MNKRNITLTALVLAGLIAFAFHIFPRLYHPQLLGLFYFPSILLTMILSGGGHSPSMAAGWISFVAYTLLYWALFIVLSAILWEMYLLRKALHHLDDAQRHLTGAEPDSRKALEKIGQAIAEVETRRRKNFFLKGAAKLDLTQPPDVLAAHAIAEAGDERAVKGVLKHLHGKLTAAIGREKATLVMTRLRAEGSRKAGAES